ncbi:hypothetical protein JCM8547_003676 [Rhodosporidiobolus lusitaniae]
MDSPSPEHPPDYQHEQEEQSGQPPSPSLPPALTSATVQKDRRFDTLASPSTFTRNDTSNDTHDDSINASSTPVTSTTSPTHPATAYLSSSSLAPLLSSRPLHSLQPQQPLHAYPPPPAASVAYHQPRSFSAHELERYHQQRQLVHLQQMQALAARSRSGSPAVAQRVELGQGATGRTVYNPARESEGERGDVNHEVNSPARGGAEQQEEQGVVTRARLRKRTSEAADRMAAEQEAGPASDGDSSQDEALAASVSPKRRRATTSEVDPSLRINAPSQSPPSARIYPTGLAPHQPQPYYPPPPALAPASHSHHHYYPYHGFSYVAPNTQAHLPPHVAHQAYTSMLTGGFLHTEYGTFAGGAPYPPQAALSAHGVPQAVHGNEEEQQQQKNEDEPSSPPSQAPNQNEDTASSSTGSPAYWSTSPESSRTVVTSPSIPRGGSLNFSSSSSTSKYHPQPAAPMLPPGVPSWQAAAYQNYLAQQQQQQLQQQQQQQRQHSGVPLVSGQGGGVVQAHLPPPPSAQAPAFGSGVPVPQDAGEGEGEGEGEEQQEVVKNVGRTGRMKAPENAFVIDAVPGLKPFITKLRFLVQHPEEVGDAICWSASGNEVLVKIAGDTSLVSDVLPRCFQHENPGALYRQFTVRPPFLPLPSVLLVLTFSILHSPGEQVYNFTHLKDPKLAAPILNAPPLSAVSPSPSHPSSCLDYASPSPAPTERNVTEWRVYRHAHSREEYVAAREAEREYERKKRAMGRSKKAKDEESEEEEDEEEEEEEVEEEEEGEVWFSRKNIDDMTVLGRLKNKTTKSSSPSKKSAAASASPSGTPSSSPTKGSAKKKAPAVAAAFSSNTAEAAPSPSPSPSRSTTSSLPAHTHTHTHTPQPYTPYAFTHLLPSTNSPGNQPLSGYYRQPQLQQQGYPAYHVPVEQHLHPTALAPPSQAQRGNLAGILSSASVAAAERGAAHETEEGKEGEQEEEQGQEAAEMSLRQLRGAAQGMGIRGVLTVSVGGGSGGEQGERDGEGGEEHKGEGEGDAETVVRRLR